MTRVLLVLVLTGFISGWLLTGCSPKDKIDNPGSITMIGEIVDFSEVGIYTKTTSQSLFVKGAAMKSDIVVTVSGDFEIALDDTIYLEKITIPAPLADKSTTIHIRCAPARLGNINGILRIESGQITPKSYSLKATGVKVLKTVSTFISVRHAWGGGFSQTNSGVFNFPSKPQNIEKIIMFIKLACPLGGCNGWDVYANIRVKDTITGKWLEIGRYITPYGVSNSQIPKGFMIDVTDFKALLTGKVNLRSFIEAWGVDGWLLTVNFEITEGIPDFKYYAVSEIIQYNSNSLEGIPYGEPNNFVMDKIIKVPATSQKTILRTVITGWGHATPSDPDGRPCAEWCFRSHKILINGVPTFTHLMNGIGCGANPVNPQNGNWEPDRAGWCPGMEVPVRTDELDGSLAGNSFTWKYQLVNWTNDFKSTADNIHAYYAISSFVIAKSNAPFTALPVVN